MSQANSTDLTQKVHFRDLLTDSFIVLPTVWSLQTCPKGLSFRSILLVQIAKNIGVHLCRPNPFIQYFIYYFGLVSHVSDKCLFVYNDYVYATLVKLKLKKYLNLSLYNPTLLYPCFTFDGMSVSSNYPQ